jgi:hypothetical protein
VERRIYEMTSNRCNKPSTAAKKLRVHRIKLSAAMTIRSPKTSMSIENFSCRAGKSNLCDFDGEPQRKRLAATSQGKTVNKAANRVAKKIDV